MNWNADGLTSDGEGAFQPTSWKYGREVVCIGLNGQEGSAELLQAVAQDRTTPFGAVPKMFEIKAPKK